MSVPEFLNRLRLVAGMLPPALLAGGELDVTDADERLRQKALASADVWLDPSFVAGVKPADFWFLDDFNRSRLADAFDRFTRATESTSADGVLGPDQRERGLDALVELAQVLQPVDALSRNLSSHLWQLEPDFREYVLGFDCRFGLDPTGDPAVWVRAVVPDDVDVQTPAFDRFMDAVTRSARKWLDAAGLPHWPYVRLLTPSAIKEQFAEVVG